MNSPGSARSLDLEEKRLCIFGTGGFGRETLLIFIDCLKSQGISSYADHVVFMVDDECYDEFQIMGVRVIRLSDFDVAKYKVIVAVGDPEVRRSIVEKLPLDTEYPVLVHPASVLSDWVKLGEGTIVAAGVAVTCNIEFGRHTHLNLHTTVGHDCVLGDYFTSAPGVAISGNCTIGECVYFGSNASVRQGISICSDVTIGMGGTVVKSINESGVYVGNPVSKLRRISDRCNGYSGVVSAIQ